MHTQSKQERSTPRPTAAGSTQETVRSAAERMRWMDVIKGGKSQEGLGSGSGFLRIPVVGRGSIKRFPSLLSTYPKSYIETTQLTQLHNLTTSLCGVANAARKQFSDCPRGDKPKGGAQQGH